MTEPWICPRCDTVNAPIAYSCQGNCTPGGEQVVNIEREDLVDVLRKVLCDRCIVGKELNKIGS